MRAGVICLCVALFAALGRPAAAATAREMYTETLAREQIVRAALAKDPPPASILTNVRTVVAAYQEIVRLYPASGYSDNALWQAGVLSLDAFLRFGQVRDRTLGLRLLRLLTTEYPTSSRVRHVSEQIDRLERAAAPEPPPSVAAPAASAPRGLATIRDIRREVLADAVRVTIELDREVGYYDERLPNPVRVFLDLPKTRAVPALQDQTLRFDGDADIVRQIRIGRHPDDVTRVVLDAGGISSYSVYALYNPYRLVIDCFRESEAEVVEAVPPVTTPPVAVPEAPAAAPPPTPVPPAATAAADRLPPLTATAVPPRIVGGGYTMARQLGLRVSRIVIDPGHGGHDPGAKGRSINEAELVLDIALRVEKLLQDVPGIEVILTRRGDDYVPLQERTALANREGADLFLSIHANASPNSSASGVETYFLNFASNMSAASVAARENAASGQAMGALPDFLKSIALNNKLDESRDFATEVQTAMVERLRRSNRSLKDLGVKQAPFVVLIGAAMPSVLTEVSFVTNSLEARLLRGPTYRQQIAQALVDAVQKYQTSLQNVARVAQQ